MLSSIHSLARSVKGQNVYSVPTLLTRTSGETASGETGSSCGEFKVFSFAVLPPHLPWKATTVEIDTLTPRLAGLEQGSCRNDCPARFLMLSKILLAHGADNNGTRVPCGNRWGEIVRGE
jgi:hypothetical protein